MSKISKKSDSGVKATAAPNNLLNEQEPKFNLVKITLILFALASLASTIIFDTTTDVNSLPMTIIGISLLIGVAVFLIISNKLNEKSFIFLIFLAGFLLRLNYVLYTDLGRTVRVRQHDVYGFGTEKGHAGYIEYFYNNGFTLPDDNPMYTAQFYHPPLHHFLSALWMRLLTTFGMGYDRAITSLQYLVMFYSSCCMLVSYKIFKELKIKGLGLYLATATVAFHPTLIILAGSINNDILSILFSLLALYTTLKWYNDSNIKNIIPIALSIGLGMMTKISVVIIAIPVAFLFLVKLANQKKSKTDFVKQYVVFGAICIPLGLFSPIRNYIKFKTPIGYVPGLSEGSDQYIGFRTTFERLFDFSYNPFSNIYLNRVSAYSDYYEYNPFVALIKTSLFGEYNFSTTKGIAFWAHLLLYFNIALIVVALAAEIFVIIKKMKGSDKNIFIFLGFYHILLIINYVSFCFKFPHTCSMDFRYITPALTLGALFLGSAVTILNTDEKYNKKITKILNCVAACIVVVFCLSSTAVYVILQN